MAKQGSILVVDDEMGVREALSIILKPVYEVHTAANGKEALECIQNKKVDLVILDLKMPGLSGVDVLKEIKKLNEDIEVIILTGYGTLTNAREVIHYGAGDFISKPFNVADIISTVSNALERRKNNQGIKDLIQHIKHLRTLGDNEPR